MSGPIRVEPDGTRVYSNGTRYRPKKLSERSYGIRKPDDPRAVRFETRWFVPFEVLPDEARTLPETVPDDVAYDHAAKPFPCACGPCSRPTARFWFRRYQRQVLGITPRSKTQSRIDSEPESGSNVSSASEPPSRR